MASQVSKTVDTQIEKGDLRVLIFDFTGMTFMDSSGIGVIMGRYKKVCCFGGKVYAIHTNERIKKIIRMSGLQNIVEIIS